MKIAYFDCPSGLSGNMILGALLDAGLSLAFFRKELRKLQAMNYKLQITKTKKHGIAGIHLTVKPEKERKRRRLADILSIINKSGLSGKVKTASSAIFRRLADAEAKIHGVPVNQIHFHEVGAIDAIIDIVGAVIGLEKLGVEKVFCSPLPIGHGKIKHAHGLLPNPSPAAAELLKGIPTYGTNIQGELVTPTGAAIISTLAESFGDPPRMRVSAIGYGAGSRNLSVPNLLRVFVGEADIPTERDAVLQMEANIDDMDPRLYSKAIRNIMQAGALDAYILPILMKKNRQAVKLTVLTAPERRDKVLKEIFTQTTTLGVRVYLTAREKLTRKFIRVKTRYGRAKVKIGLWGEKIKTIAPEFEDYQRMAAKHRRPAAKVYRLVKRAAVSRLFGR